MKVGKAAVVIIIASSMATGCSYLGAAKIPTGEQMKGTWTGTSSGHENGRNTGTNVTFLIDQSSGQSFSGTIEYQYNDKRTGKEKIHGSIGKNGDIAIADEDGFYINGILDRNSLSLQYIESSPEESEASNVYLKRK